jgi:alpha,alpha-trehalase
MHFRRWLYGIIAQTEDLSRLQILYPLRAGESTEEKCLEHLCGYKDSRPVRIGNAAAAQRQLDIYGEFLNMVYDTTRYGKDIHEEDWPLIRRIVDYVCEIWPSKDSGIWEARSPPTHYVYSKVMCWVALDRGIKIASQSGWHADLEKWQRERAKLREAILAHGFDEELKSFVRSFGSRSLDATALLIPVVGFLPFDDPRVAGTIDAVMKTLMTREGMVARYHANDGLPGGEGSFVLCSFWLVRALSLSGRNEEAEKLFTKILRYMSPLGLISEEVDPVSGKLLGNLPQAFSHIGFINAALHLGIGKGKKHKGPKPIGEEQRA